MGNCRSFAGLNRVSGAGMGTGLCGVFAEEERASLHGLTLERIQAIYKGIIFFLTLARIVLWKWNLSPLTFWWDGELVVIFADRVILLLELEQKNLKG